ncbi:MAG TPA: nucleoside triphosphate pyrophosphohydrolase family protein, partial [Patescibacteria group bacterium]|nr:nucleoside triphosphate pyrophosphohydrolase family protein [Patescibacteria group bacterium]
MTPEEYIQAALRTEPSSYGFSETNGISPRLEHAILGITTEAGELLDVVKKAKIYGKPFDRAHVAEELGDVFWYSAVLADELGVSFEEIWKKNILKLQAR